MDGQRDIRISNGEQGISNVEVKRERKRPAAPSCVKSLVSGLLPSRFPVRYSAVLVRHFGADGSHGMLERQKLLEPDYEMT